MEYSIKNSSKIQLNALESSLKSLKTSQLMKETVYRYLVEGIEKHVELMKQASKTGRPPKLMKHAAEDTHFFFTLARLLNETQSDDSNEAYEKLGLVYQWFLSNRRQLYLGPRFGKAKKEIPKMPEWKSRKCQSAVSREKVLAGWQLNKAASEPADFASLTKDGTNASQSDERSTWEDHERAQKENFEIFQTEIPDEIFARRKLPLSHTHNPLVRAFVQMDKIHEQNKKEKNESALTKDGVLKSVPAQNKSALLERWDQIKTQYSANQENLGNLQYLGRSGTAGTVRYTAHDQGPAVERATAQVLAHFAKAMQQEGSISTQSEKPAFQTSTLEEFYEFNEPQKVLEQMNSREQSKLRRGSARDMNGRVTSSRVMTSSRMSRRPSSVASGAKRRMSSAYASSVISDADNDASSVKVDDVLSVIDDVTSDMTSYKEKLVPDPKPGFRKPTVKLHNQFRPQTAPAGCNSVVSDLSDSVPSSAAPWPQVVEFERQAASSLEYRPNREVRMIPRRSYCVTPHARPTSVVSQPKTDTDIVYINHIEDDDDDEPDHVTNQPPVEDAIHVLRLKSEVKMRRPPQRSPVSSMDNAWRNGLDSFQLDDFFYIKEGAPLEYLTFCASMSSKGKWQSRERSVVEPEPSAKQTLQYGSPLTSEIHSSALDKSEISRPKILARKEDVPERLSEHRQLIEEVNRLLRKSEEKTRHSSLSPRLPKETEESGSSGSQENDTRDKEMSMVIVSGSNHKLEANETTSLRENVGDGSVPILHDQKDVTEMKSLRDIFDKSHDVNVKKEQREVKLTPGFKHRLYQRTFAVPSLKPAIDSESLRLSVMGGPRMSGRNAGRILAKARASSPTGGKRKEQETLRRAREAARTPRSAPSIPFQGQGQGTRLRGPYQKELEEHARLHPKPLAYMEKIEALRQHESIGMAAPENDFVLQNLTTSSIKVHTLRGSAPQNAAEAGQRDAKQSDVRDAR